MRASTVTKSLVAADDNGIAESQSLAAAGNLTLNGALVVAGVGVLGSQRQVIITSAGNDSAITWTVIGTADGGSAIKDIFAGANTDVAASNLSFTTVTSIHGSAATASTVIAGTNSVGASPWKMFSDTIATPSMSFDAEVTGTVNYSVQYTQEPFLTPISPNGSNSPIALAPASPNPIAHDLPGLSGLAVSAQGSFNFVFHAWRLVINSGTGSVSFTGRQAGLASP